MECPYIVLEAAHTHTHTHFVIEIVETVSVCCCQFFKAIEIFIRVKVINSGSLEYLILPGFSK
jgi:hypothetical protein